MKTAENSCAYNRDYTRLGKLFILPLLVIFNLPALSGKGAEKRVSFFAVPELNTQFYLLSGILYPNDTLEAAQNTTQREAIQKTEQRQATQIQFLGVPDDIILNCGEPMPEWPVVTAKDHQFEFQVFPGEKVNFTPCGGRNITRSWSVRNAEGTTITKNQNISFSDSEAPLLDIGNDTVVHQEVDLPLPFYEASDQGCSSFVVDITEEEYTLKKGTTSVLWKFVATDGCGNTTTKIQHIHIETEDPKLESKTKSVSSLEYR